MTSKKIIHNKKKPIILHYKTIKTKTSWSHHIRGKNYAVTFFLRTVGPLERYVPYTNCSKPLYTIDINLDYRMGLTWMLLLEWERCCCWCSNPLSKSLYSFAISPITIYYSWNGILCYFRLRSLILVAMRGRFDFIFVFNLFRMRGTLHIFRSWITSLLNCLNLPASYKRFHQNEPMSSSCGQSIESAGVNIKNHILPCTTISSLRTKVWFYIYFQLVWDARQFPPISKLRLS